MLMGGVNVPDIRGSAPTPDQNWTVSPPMYAHVWMPAAPMALRTFHGFGSSSIGNRRSRSVTSRRITRLLLNTSQNELCVLLSCDSHRFNQGREPRGVHVIDLREIDSQGVRF